ncbi:MAG: hypothetical protein RLY31_2065 [Bacteroidota bacterium]|jgi:hypothetical protein
MLALVYVLGYHVGQHDFPAMAICFIWLFLGYAYVNCRGGAWNQGRSIDLYWFWMAVLMRLVLLFSIPSLSNDAYRFVWDGRLVDAGISPYAALPSHYLQPGQSVPGLDATLFAAFGSKDTYSCYPPLAQAQFWFGSHFSQGNLRVAMLLMKSWLFMFEVGNLLLLASLLQRFGLSGSRLLLYALHPMILLEGMGNLHFEVAMIFFVLLSVWLLDTAMRTSGFHRSWWLFTAGAAFALAVAAKLLPLLLLPFCWSYLPSSGRKLFYTSVGICTAVCFWPMFSGVGASGSFAGFFNSLGLYFRQLEFNGSVYYLFRWVGYQLHGYNRIAVIGPVLGTAAALLLTAMAVRNAIRRRSKGLISGPDLFRYWLYAYSIYLLSATTVHPWYLSLVVAFSVFTRWKYGLVWSALVVMTYVNYWYVPYREDLRVVAAEYILVAAAWGMDRYHPQGWVRVCKFVDPKPFLQRIWAYRSIFARLRQ